VAAAVEMTLWLMHSSHLSMRSVTVVTIFALRTEHSQTPRGSIQAIIPYARNHKHIHKHISTPPRIPSTQQLLSKQPKTGYWLLVPSNSWEIDNPEPSQHADPETIESPACGALWLAEWITMAQE
jgi:hypothetical protein